jgi:hypothetical protein
MAICGDEVHICRNCLAVLWHLRRPAAPKHRPPARAPDAQGAEARQQLRTAARQSLEQVA